MTVPRISTTIGIRYTNCNYPEVRSYWLGFGLGSGRLAVNKNSRNFPSMFEAVCSSPIVAQENQILRGFGRNNNKNSPRKYSSLSSKTKFTRSSNPRSIPCSSRPPRHLTRTTESINLVSSRKDSFFFAFGLLIAAVAWVKGNNGLLEVRTCNSCQSVMCSVCGVCCEVAAKTQSFQPSWCCCDRFAGRPAVDRRSEDRDLLQERLDADVISGDAASEF